MIESAASDDRLSQRRSVLLDARCRTSRWQVHRVELANLSAGGCRVIGSPGLVPGQDVVLRIADLKGLAGTVRWAREGDAGIEFASSLGQSTTDRLIAAYALPA